MRRELGVDSHLPLGVEADREGHDLIKGQATLAVDVEQGQGAPHTQRGISMTRSEFHAKGQLSLRR